MAIKKSKSASEMLAAIIMEGIHEKKGESVIQIDLREIKNAVADFFIVCHAASRAQMEAIAESVTVEVKKALGMQVWKKEGFENAEWIILDYVDVVVHIFQQPIREHYKLEELWADADVREFTPAPPKKTTKRTKITE